jgi:hypothetical protein
MNQRTVLSCREETCHEGQPARYRYLLRVALPTLAQGPASPTRRLTVILKNPSLADARRSDPTAGKVEAWARHNGFGEVVYANLFAYRSPYPTALNALSYAEAVGAENDAALLEAVALGDTLVAAWGNPNGIDPSRYQRRIDETLTLLAGAGALPALHIVGPLTQQSHPRHGLLWNTGHALRVWNPTDCPAPQLRG